jgi:hypothetical protein
MPQRAAPFDLGRSGSSAAAQFMLGVMQPASLLQEQHLCSCCTAVPGSQSWLDAPARCTSCRGLSTDCFVVPQQAGPQSLCHVKTTDFGHSGSASYPACLDARQAPQLDQNRYGSSFSYPKCQPFLALGTAAAGTPPQGLSPSPSFPGATSSKQARSSALDAVASVMGPGFASSLSHLPPGALELLCSGGVVQEQAMGYQATCSMQPVGIKVG